MAEPSFLGITAGEWLQAAANFFGVAVTIIGTLYIERRMRGEDERENNSRIREVVSAISDAAGAIRAGLPDDPDNDEHFGRSLQMQNSLKSALDMYTFVRGDTKTKNLRLWRALRSLDDALRAHGPTLEKEYRLLTFGGRHPEVFRVNRSKVMFAAGPVYEAAQAVLAVDV